MSERRRFERLTAAVEDEYRGVRRLPVLTVDDAGVLARGFFRRAAKIGKARAEQAEKRGEVIACKAGCSACCRTVVVVTEPEAIAVAQWLLEDGNEAARAHFERGYPEWRKKLGPKLDELMELHEADDTDGTQAKFTELQDENVMCAFLRRDRCTIYSMRPNICRLTAVMDTNEHCQLGATESPTLVGFLAFDEYMDEARPVLHTAHNRLREGKPEPLCDAVHRLLADPAALARKPSSKVGRNAPCPCGSGKKHKRCCGR